MEMFSITLSALGLIVALYSLFQATNAKQLVMRTIKQKDSQEDGARFQQLIKKIREANKASSRRYRDAPKSASVGKKLDQDKLMVQYAEDALRTELPLSASEDLRNAADATAKSLNQSMQAISKDLSDRDHWGDVRAEIQIIIPKLELEEREYKNRIISD